VKSLLWTVARMARAEISLLDPLDARWAAFVESIPQANIFHHPAWANLLAECYGYRSFIIALIDENETICAGLPVLEVSSALTGRRWTSLPFTDYCQPLYHDRNAFESLTLGLVDLFQHKNPPVLKFVGNYQHAHPSKVFPIMFITL